ncbi:MULTISPECIES: flagellar basal body-associated FliL family protein [unclassified Xanthobacter]|uniref:flagellar basal body-associated FliL family protein n=1 Tax=unclassified Xanthobacter TaxID=2623496 RepID=UPI001EDF1E75|nr:MULTISPECIES: flagellar basal body-associated FliL family protein [unclassified Xanthobacter]
MPPSPSKDAGKDAGGAKKGGGLIVALLILTLLAAGLGGGLGYQLAGTVEKVVSAKIAAEPKVEPPPPLRYAGDMTLKELKPVVVNLAAPSSAFVRLEAALVFKNGALANPDVTAAEIREDMMAYVRTLSLSQLEGPSALQHLREDLNDRAGVRSEGKVAELVLVSLVVQ